MYTIFATSATEAANNFNEILAPIMNEIQGAISVGDIVAMVGVALGFGLVFTLAWFGIRKLVRIAMSAIQGRGVSL